MFARLRGAKGVWFLTAVMVPMTAGLLFGLRNARPLADAPVPMLGVAALYAAATVFVVYIQFRRDAVAFSLTDLPLVLGLFFLTPLELFSAYVMGVAVALTVHHKQSSLKLLFNLSRGGFETAAAAAVFHAIISLGDPLGPAGWAATFAATVTVDTLSTASITFAISLMEGKFDQLPRVFGVSTLTTLSNACLAFIAVIVVWYVPEAAWLIAVPATGIFFAYKVYTSVNQKHESLQLLYRSTRTLQESLDVGSTLEGLVRETAEMFKAEGAQVVLLPESDGEPAARTELHPSGSIDSLVPTRLDPTRGVWARVVAEGQALLLASPIKNDALAAHFAQHGMGDAMVAPLRADNGVFGTMMVYNRRGDFATFNQDDLQLFETLVNHAGVALENSRLVGRLRQQAADNEYMARHDSLTGLLNRGSFQSNVRDLLSQIGEHPMAVMLMDLDGFKEINDTLGHHAGDIVLRVVADRLETLLASRAIVARLGGDEFAIMLHSVDEVAAQAAARSVLQTLHQPFEVESLMLDIRASIGIAMHPADGRDAETLLQRADVAMYQAKEMHSGCEIYAFERDSYSAARLSLVGELRRAIEQQELQLVYQPKVDLASGKVVGFEALVRWNHQPRGFVPPDEFIPIAEHSGLMKPLTHHVLRSALRRWRTLVSNGIVVPVSVNISARSLIDTDFPAEIAGLLSECDVSPKLLQLEITESSIMSDPDRVDETLGRLHAMGVGLSIDDFGTGYSSLSHLKKLPASEIKIDRSFILNMSEDDNDAAIVRSTIDLGHNLGLSVVAEGVETQEVIETLIAQRCDVVQGYGISRPLASDRIEEWAVSFQTGTLATYLSERRQEATADVIPMRREMLHGS